jgi:DNA-directed RNA polymerase subunit RPC12/RpoP
MANSYKCLDCGSEFAASSAAPGNCRCSHCEAKVAGRNSPAKTVGKKAVKQKREVRGRVFRGIAVLLCFAAAVLIVWRSNTGKSGEKVDGNLQAAQINQIIMDALDINVKTPMMIDSSTRLDQVVAEGDKIIYKSTLVFFTAENGDGEMFKKAIGPYLAEKYCKDENSRKALELGVKYGYEYYGNDGTLLYTAIVSIDDC